MNTFKQIKYNTRKDINKSGFEIVIGKRKLVYKSVGFGFDVFENGKVYPSCK